MGMLGAAGLSLTMLGGPAAAGDIFGRTAEGSMKDAPAPAGRELSWSVNIGGTSDYVFRGISQNLEDPAIQGGADLSYGLFYLGIWGSNVDFVPGSGGPFSGDASVEVDIYAGIKPTLGMFTFDLGVIYYWYPGAEDALNAELDYVEIKGGVGVTLDKLALGFTVYYSPEYTAQTGQTWTLEGSAGYTLPDVWIFSPTISGVIGTTLFDDNSNLDYAYWNAGLALGVEKFTFDFRYWDTDSNGADFCALQGLCDERFVFTAKVALP